jgi:hypothetical protein
MVAQGLRAPTASSPAELVGRMVAVQAQEFGYALWGVAQRVAACPTRRAVLQAFDSGDVLRTHVLRPTWHFVAPQDARWLLRLTTPRLRRQMASYDRQQGIDGDVLARSHDVLAAAVAGGHHRTRRDLAAALESAGIATGNGRISFLLIHAEFDEVLISGAMSGKQQTYAAFDERVPPSPDSDEEQALARLASRYLATRGPATAKDLATWAGLTLGQARRGLAVIDSDCAVVDVEGMTMYALREATPERAAGRGSAAGPVVDLLQGFDEMIMSYLESRWLLAPPGVLPVADHATHAHAVLIDGALVGHWRARTAAGGAGVDVQLRRPLRADEQEALQQAVSRYGEYLGTPCALTEQVLLDNI